jgi:hypothetical protein
MKQAPLSTEQIEALRRMQGTQPLYRFAADLGVARNTVAAALAGLKLHPGTQLLLSMRIKDWTASNSAAVETCAA